MKIIYCRFILPLLIFLSFSTTDTLAYNVTSLNLLGSTISGNVMRDGNGLIDNQISGTGIGNTDGIQLVAYLVDANNNIIDKTNVSPGGSYTFNQVANGSFTVAISTNNVAVGLTLATISANLPVGWNAVGESYGIGNSRSGFEMGIPNLQIAAVVTNPNKNILSVNFALDQSPVVSNDFFTTPIDNSFEITVLANDTDPNGNNTINKTTVSLIDPADNVKKSTVTIIGQGVYVVNPISGTVNFDPVPTFMGVTTKIKYTVKDDAGIESNEGVLSVLVKPVGVNDAGRTPIDAPIVIIVKANDGNSAIGTIVSIAVPPVNGSVVVNPDGSITYTPVSGDKGTYTYTYLLTTVDGVTSEPITVTVAVGIQPAIGLLKTNVFNDANGDGAAQVGETVTYTFTVTNTGDVPVTATTITDPKLNLVNAALVPANLAPGQTGQLSAVYTITQADIDAGSVSNTAVATAKDPIDLPVTDVSGTTNNNDMPTVIVVSQNPSIALLKTSVFNDTNEDGFAQVGETITYNFTVTNTGNVSVTGANITDPKVNLVNAPTTPANLAPGQTGTLTAVHTLNQADIDAGSVTNTATATALDPNNAQVTDVSGTANNNNTPTVIVVSQNPSIALVKTGIFNDTNADGFAQVGETVTYIFNVTNTGNVSLTGANITDPKVNLVNAPIAPANLAPGQTGTLSAIYILTQADINAGRVSNTATAKSTDPKNQPVTDVSGTSTNNNTPTIIVVSQNPSISLVKTSVFNDLNADGIVQVGETITYTFTVTNSGNVSVTGTSITDPKINLVNAATLPANLSPGEIGTLSAIYTITQADINAGSVTNTATATALDPANKPVTDVSGTGNSNNTPTVIAIGQNPSISLVKSSIYFDKDNNGVVNAGDVINYIFTLKNTGNVTLSGITVTDPNVTVLGGLLNNFNAGATNNSNFSAIYTITQNDINKGVVYNLASVNAIAPNATVITGGSTSGNSVDPSNPTNPLCPTCTVTKITQIGSISLIKTVSNVGTGVNGTFILGNDILYKFTITNTGNLTLNNFVVNDPKLNNPIINIPGTLLPGQTSTFTATYKITAADIALGRVNNQASISSTDVNNNPFTDVSGTTINANDITVTQLAKPPIAVDDAVPIKQNQTIIIEILKNDIGVSSNLVPTSVFIITQPIHGIVTVNANGTVTYTPNPDYLGNDSFTYTVRDVNGMISNIATVNITLGKTMPLAVDDTFKTDLNKSVKVDVISNDIPDGSPFVISTLKIIAQPQFGRVTKNSDGSYTYTPNTDFAGKDEFTYNVEDANGNVTNTATVKIEVAGFFVPNVFTPNGDGVNDTFEIVGKDNYTAVELEIYNRWGNQVYKSANYQNQWVAEGLNEGTYFYTLKLKSATDSKFVKGWVLVKR